MASNNLKEGKKLFKILMLHGYRQNEALFKDRTGSVRKILKNKAEFIYCEAPHEIRKLDASSAKGEESVGVNSVESGNNEAQKGWWLRSKDYPEISREEFDKSVESTLELMNEIFEKKGPIDAVFGFSLGGTVATLLSYISSLNERQDFSTNAEDEKLREKYKWIKFKFAVIVATIRSPESSHDVFYSKQIPMPTLHVIGKGDKLVDWEKAEKLTEYFVEPKVFIHDAGHFIPVNAEAKKIYTEFVEQMSKKFLENNLN